MEELEQGQMWNSPRDRALVSSTDYIGPMSAREMHRSKIEDSRKFQFLSCRIDRARPSSSVFDEFPFGTDNARRNTGW